MYHTNHQIVWELCGLHPAGLDMTADHYPSGSLGWMSLLTIIEHLKERTPKRGSEGGLAGLAKRVKGVNLGS